MNKKKQYILVFGLVAALLIIDQVVKILVKTHMSLGQDIALIGDWCYLTFTENEGFAFGTSFGGVAGKVALTLFRLVASGVLLWYILRKMKAGMRTSLAISLALIFAGAVGNLIDSCFYGIIFSQSTYSIATLFPPEGGYAPLLQGKVVDMFYFPLFEFDWPQWLPWIGGNHFLFFGAIFNVADAAITVGAFWLIIDLMVQEHKSKKIKQNPSNSQA